MDREYKKNFFKLYQEVKDEKVDLLSLPTDKLEKIYKIMEEEIKIKINIIEGNKQRIKKINKELLKYKKN